ncbi:replication-relaxation family protein (plasmid) [Streptomyces sp. NBC_00289]|uniref:replication-relaxation family protein n=1 Tax=Streptomyces sp. NBC_00289 TaxID=2975703 RepID=UPI002F90A83D
MGGSKTYPYGSTSAVRAHVLAALGVLKVATADQMHRLMAPGHKDNKAFRNAALDLARHGLVVSEGSARDGNKIWNLTPLGLDAAAGVLGRAAGEMGGTARGAARSGAAHAMAVNETVIAITRTPAAATRPVPRQTPGVPDQSPARGDVPPPNPADGVPQMQGLGWIGSWSTEVPLSLPGSKAGRAGVRADAVLQAPEELPVLFVEVDNCTESAAILAAKFEKYLRYFRVKIKNSVGKDMPAWRALYRPSGRDGHPPILIVFNPGTRTGPQALKNRMNTVMELTRTAWSGDYHPDRGYGAQDKDGFYDYTDAIPLLFTTLDRLQADSPRGVVWWRCGHGQWETLPAALANPADHSAWHARDEQRRLRHKEAEEASRQEHAPRTPAWPPTPDPDPWPDETAPDPVPAPAPPCERCGLPVTGQDGQDDAVFDSPENGRHCATCRSDIRQYPTLRAALFGRRQRSK